MELASFASSTDVETHANTHTHTLHKTKSNFVCPLHVSIMTITSAIYLRAEHIHAFMFFFVEIVLCTK